MGTDGELLQPFPLSTKRSVEDLKKLWIRNVATGSGDETTPWKRYAILPCVEGQKYTIGRQFTSRAEQGEFIYLPGNLTNMSKDDRPVCQITVEQERYWVNPTGTSWAGVLINRVKVVEKTELKFGDKLSLGVANVAFIVLLFKKRELDPAAFICSATEGMPVKKPAKRGRKSGKANLVPSPAENGLIVSRILSYLPLDDLKNCRFVSSLWNEEAFKLLKKRCTVEFGFLNPNEKDSNETMKLLRYVADMINCPMPNWKIQVSNNNEYIHDKFSEDLNWLLSDDNAELHHVKRLELGGSLIPTSDYRLFHRLLQTLGKHLEELNLGLDFVKNHILPELEQFPKLRVFTLSCPDFGVGIVNDYQHLTKLIKGVKAFRLETSASISLKFLENLYISESWKWFSNLNEISLHRTTPDLINVLLTFPNLFKKLELNQLVEIWDFQPFGVLLSKHARTLERLQFIIPAIPNTEKNEENNRHLVFINFPAFPKLEYLNIGWNPGKMGNVQLLFPNGTSSINYRNDVPSLKSLTLWPTGLGKYPARADASIYSYQTNILPQQVWKDFGVFFEMFFPAIVEGHGDELEICDTVQHLDICNIIPVKVSAVSTVFSSTASAVIQSMFPKVRNNPWINSIRDGE